MLPANLRHCEGGLQEDDSKSRETCLINILTSEKSKYKWLAGSLLHSWSKGKIAASLSNLLGKRMQRGFSRRNGVPSGSQACYRTISNVLKKDSGLANKAKQVSRESILGAWEEVGTCWNRDPFILITWEFREPKPPWSFQRIHQIIHKKKMSFKYPESSVANLVFHREWWYW